MDDMDARELVAGRQWDRRRYSDSYPGESSHAMYRESLGGLDPKSKIGNTFHIPNRPLPGEPDRETTGRCAAIASPLITPVVVHPPCPTPPHAVEPEQPFLNWAEFHPFPITLRRQTYRPQTPREEVIDALGGIEIAKIKGLGRLAKPILNTFDNPQKLSDFLTYAQRSILRPLPDAALAAKPTPRELDRLESELFDTSKYVGSSANHVTVLTWSADSPRGTITLFEADLSRPGLAPPSPSGSLSPSHGHGHGNGLSSLALRRRGTLSAASMSLPLAHRRRRRAQLRGGAVALRPVAAMEDVPRQVLVGMRVDQGVRKLVLKHDPAENRFRWAAWYSRGRGDEPSYARLYDPDSDDVDVDGLDAGGRRPKTATEWGDEERRHRYLSPPRDLAPATATGVGFALEEDEDAVLGRSGRRRKSYARRARGRRSSLRVEDAWGRREVDADGVVATIPQFLALLHASRSIVEVAASAPATDRTVKTEDWERVRAVVLKDWPEGKRHIGRDVHVAVLVPAQADWADERIFWTDDTGGLLELRQKKYREVIDGGRIRRGSGMVRSANRGRDQRGLNPRSPMTPPHSARSTAW
ncbi:hypothetical protein MFIFM68171_08615 [Madurella fahalii]|uniref:Uncharacterized protein n=1 Tax=Madurella fahalii TaxID=1157608 RepID=A0ABQ0GLJ2_9PEZI